MTDSVISDNTTGTHIGDYGGIDDGYMADGSPTTPAGSAIWVYVCENYYSDIYRSLLNFTGLSNISTSDTVSAATVYLWLVNNNDGGSAMTVRFQRALLAWAEASACWDYYTGTTGWNTAGAAGSGTDISATTTMDMSFSTTTGQFYSGTSAQLITDVDDMVGTPASNYGWRLAETGTPAGDTRLAIMASEGTDGSLPALAITHAAAGGSSGFLNRNYWWGNY